MNHDEIVREARGLHADWMAYESMHHGGGRGAKSDDGEAKRKFMLWLVDDFPAMCELIESLQAQLAASQRREKAAVGDLTRLATKPITPCHSCAKTCVFPASLAPECQPPTWCREWQWRGLRDAEKGENNA